MADRYNHLWDNGVIMNREEMDVLDGLRSGDLEPLVQHLMTGKSGLNNMIAGALIRAIDGTDEVDFGIKCYRLPHLGRGNFKTEQELKDITKRNRSIVEEIKLAGGEERGRLSRAIFTVAQEFNLSEETIKKIWKENK